MYLWYEWMNEWVNDRMNATTQVFRYKVVRYCGIKVISFLLSVAQSSNFNHVSIWIETFFDVKYAAKFHNDTHKSPSFLHHPSLYHEKGTFYISRHLSLSIWLDIHVQNIRRRPRANFYLKLLANHLHGSSHPKYILNIHPDAHCNQYMNHIYYIYIYCRILLDMAAVTRHAYGPLL